MLSEPDQAAYAALFEPYRQGTAGQYCYRVKNDEVPGYLEEIGHLMYRLVGELEVCYADQPAYQVLQRVFAEHFALVEGAEEGPDTEQVRAKAGEELSASSLQSPRRLGSNLPGEARAGTSGLRGQPGRDVRPGK